MSHDVTVDLIEFSRKNGIPQSAFYGNISLIKNYKVRKEALIDLIHANDTQISFAEKSVPNKTFNQSNAAILFISQDRLDTLQSNAQLENSSTGYIVVTSPKLMFAKLMRYFPNDRKPQTLPNRTLAYISETAKLDPSVYIGPNCVVEEQVKIGGNTVLHNNVVIGKNCRIGKDCTIYSNVTIVADTVIGSNCRIYPNCYIGGQGFGYVVDDESGEILPLEHYGKVVIGNNVYFGGGCQVNRGTFQDTVIGNDVKIHDLSHIGHNATINDGCGLGINTLIGGSVTIGTGVNLEGVNSVGAGVTIADNVHVGVCANVMSSIRKPHSVYAGLLPAQDAVKWQDRWWNLPRKINEIMSRLGKLEDKVSVKSKLY